jgi:hypothetical protein
MIVRKPLVCIAGPETEHGISNTEQSSNHSSVTFGATGKKYVKSGTGVYAESCWSNVILVRNSYIVIPL